MKPVVTFEDLARAAREERGEEPKEKLVEKPKEKITYNQYQQRYKTEHYDLIKVLAPKDQHLKDKVKACASRKGVSINQWLIRAIEKELAQHE